MDTKETERGDLGRNLEKDQVVTKSLVESYSLDDEEDR
jgi:hypothetical protein